MDNHISRTIEEESLPSTCEIKFDCLVTMYEMGQRVSKQGFLGMQEKAHPPQWYKSQSRLTLEAIRDGDEAMLGRQLKIMLQQLDSHIAKYEN